MGTATNAERLVVFGAIHRAAVRAEWAAATAAGLDLRIRDGDGLLFGAAPGFASTMFNRGLGLAEQPGRVGEAHEFFAEHGVAGEIVLDPADVPPGVVPRVTLDAYLVAPDRIAGPVVPGLAIRTIEGDEAELWMSLIVDAYAPEPPIAALWRSMAAHVASNPARRLLLGELDGRPVAASSIQLTAEGGWVSWAGVLPEARGHGIQRAMIAARARIGVELGSARMAAWAVAGARSSRNLAAAGFERIGERMTVLAADLR